jgi:5-formyltetrahydrofolate cyclo-ligase
MEPETGMTQAWQRYRHWVCFIPCLAVTPEGYRLGRGKGYYDRLLARLATLPLTVYTVGVCPSACVLDADHAFRPDPWDVPMHGVLTEQGYVHHLIE